MSILTAYAFREAHKGGDALIAALANHDPKGMSEAQLDVMEQNLDKLGAHVSAAKTDYAHAKQGYDTAAASNANNLHAAEIINGQLAAAPEDKKAGIQDSLERLIKHTEEAQAELESLKSDMDESKKFYDELEKAYEEAGARLKGTRATLTKAMHDQERAHLHDEAAKARAAIADDVAGLHPSSDSLNAALVAMHANADRANQHADALDMKAHILAPDHPVTDDPTIKAALAEAAGQTPVASMSFADRIAALKKTS